MTVGVIVATRNRPEQVARLVRSLQSQDYPLTELVVVDSSEGDATKTGLSELQLPHGGLVTYVASAKGLPLQRNVGLGKLQRRSDVICFFDDDVELDSGYLARVVSTFAADSAQRIIGLCGNIVNEKRRGFLDRVARRLFLITDNATGKLLPSGDAGHVFAPARDQRVAVLSGCNMCFRAELFRDYGLRFDDALADYAYMEDQDCSLRAARYGDLMQLVGARLVHHRNMATRLQHRELFAMYVINSFYLLRKNLSPGPLNYLCYAWRLVGKLLQAVVVSLRTLSPGPVAGWVQGVLHIGLISPSADKRG